MKLFVENRKRLKTLNFQPERLKTLNFQPERLKTLDFQPERLEALDFQPTKVRYFFSFPRAIFLIAAAGLSIGFIAQLAEGNEQLAEGNEQLAEGNKSLIAGNMQRTRLRQYTPQIKIGNISAGIYPGTGTATGLCCPVGSTVFVKVRFLVPVH
jgi:X-X-X-Leu-X-X-Gly heptad repeat protein